jgi:serine/threonine-protein kinase
MREPPPAQLAALLQRLGLATERDFESVEATVDRMAGDLPRFESVWIGALRQARILSHFQAAEIHAGRGEALKVGRYVLCHPVQECGYMAVYRGEERQTREVLRLAVFSAQPDNQNAIQAKLETLVAVGKTLSYSGGLIAAAGSDGPRHWAASPWVEGTSLADFVLHHGRFPPQAVMEIARAMLGELAALETAGLVHGDIRLQNILVATDGEVRVPHGGLRGAIRPYEGVSSRDLAPDACGTLAPERVTGGTPPTAASDLFACGCVWWHILCGRPPLGGGDTLARLRAAQAATINDLHQWVADVPGVLVEAIHDCLQKDPRRRPKSMADLAQRLGPLRRHGRQAIARCLAAAARPRAPWLRSKPTQGKKPARPHRLTVAALALLAAVAVAWPLWVAHNRPQAVETGSVDTNPKRQRGNDLGSSLTLRVSVDQKGERHIASPRESSPRPTVDSAVTPAGYSDASGTAILAASSPHGLQARASADQELRLPTDRPVRGEMLNLKPGQRVRAQGGRARVVVPREGLAVQANRVSFENVDFVSEERIDLRAIGNEASPALIRLLAAECDFAGCSFQSANGSPELSAAIIWQHASAERPAAVSLPSGRIHLKNCVFRRVGVGVESHVQGAIDLEIVNSLHLGPGPMVRLTHSPAADEPLRIRLSQVTLREADALLDCRCTNLRDASGEISIEASGCILAPRAQATLLRLTADVFPESLLHEMKWTGQGSVLAGKVVFGRWNGRDGTRQTIDDATISIAGLVRGEVEFAGKCDGDPASSRIVDCQAPLQDSESAGAATRDLPPEIKADGR